MSGIFFLSSTSINFFFVNITDLFKVVAAARLTMLRRTVAVVGKTVERIVNNSADTWKNPDEQRCVLVLLLVDSMPQP